MPFDQKAWLDSMALDAADRKAVEGLLANPKLVEKIGPTVMARSDYSRSMDELTKKQKESQDKLDTENAKVQDFYAKTTAWTKDKEKILADTEAKAAKHEAEVARIKAETIKLQQQYAIDPNDVKSILETPMAAAAAVVPKVEPARDPNTGKYVTQEEAQSYPMIPAALSNLQQTHARLFPGKEFDAEALTASAMKNRRSLKDEYEVMFDAPKRRAELAEADVQAKIKKGIEEGLIAARSEINPATGPSGAQVVAPVLAMQIDRPKFDQPLDPRRGVSDAVVAYKAHKYGVKTA